MTYEENKISDLIDGGLLKQEQQGRMIKLSELKRHPANPRIWTDEETERLKKSIAKNPRFMELNPLKIDGDKIIFAGNFRHYALELLAQDPEFPNFTDEIPESWIKVMVGFDEQEKLEFLLLDNDTHNGEWNYDLIDTNEAFKEVDLSQYKFYQDIFFNEEEPHETQDKTEQQIIGEQQTKNNEQSNESNRDEKFIEVRYIFAEKQHLLIKAAIKKAYESEEYNYIETFGNTHTLENSLYLIASEYIK